MMITFPSPEEFSLDFERSSADTFICEIGSLVEIRSCKASGFWSTKNTVWDFDVWLPSRGMNLQRDLCWTPLQKEQLIWSVLRRRPIPPVAICNFEEVDGRRVRQVIDGKQRMHAIAEFLAGEFPIHWKGREFYRCDIPQEYSLNLGSRPLFGYLAFDLTEDQKVDWFNQINFMGTPQDEAHYKRLLKEA